MMQDFFKKITEFVQSDDQIVRNFIAFHSYEFPFIPSEIVNTKLKSAISADLHDRSSILIYCNIENVNEESLPYLLQLLNMTPKIKWHLILPFVRNLPFSVIEKHENELKKYVEKGFFQFCRRCSTDNKDRLWRLFNQIVDRLEERYDYNLFAYSKKLQDKLIEKDFYNQTHVTKILEREINNEWFSMTGIFAVRAVGKLKLEQFIVPLSSHLDGDDDLLLEEIGRAFPRFQSDEVTRAVGPYTKSKNGYFTAIDILKQTKTTLAKNVLLESYSLLGPEGKESVLDGLTAHFTEEAFPLIEDFIANDYNGGAHDMEEMFYGFHKVMNRTHDLMDEWKTVFYERKQYFREKDFSDTLPKKIISQNSVKTGRNDLCPCGSGKKYKRCCGT